MNSELGSSMIDASGNETGRREFMAAFAGVAASAVLFQAMPAGAATEAAGGAFGPCAGPQIAMTCTLLEALFPQDAAFFLLKNGAPEAIAMIRGLVHLGADAETFTDNQIRAFTARADEVEHLVLPLAAEMAVHPLTFVKGAPGSPPSEEGQAPNIPSSTCILAFSKCNVEASEILAQLVSKCPATGGTLAQQLSRAVCLTICSTFYAIMLASCYHDLQNG